MQAKALGNPAMVTHRQSIARHWFKRVLLKRYPAQRAAGRYGGPIAMVCPFEMAVLSANALAWSQLPRRALGFS